MKHFFIKIMAAIICAPFLALRALAERGPSICNSAGSHMGSIGRNAESALPLAYTVVKWGTDPATQVDICGATDRPCGITDSNSGDNADAGDRVSVKLLNCGHNRIAIASEALTAGADVFTAANGKLGATGGAGKYLVGQALTAAGADGDEFEVSLQTPVLQS